jgi:hypothetical protein
MTRDTRVRKTGALVIGFVLAMAAVAAETSELPERVVHAFQEDFATGEFILVVQDRARTGPREIWSYAPETDTLQYVMTAPGGSPLEHSRTDCCVLWDYEAKRVHVGGIGRETVSHRFGSWAPDVEVAGRDLECYSPGLVGEPPRLLLMYTRTLWTYISLFGAPQRRETTKRWLELRDPWTYAKTATTEVSEESTFYVAYIKNVDDNTCLTYESWGARFLSLDPFQFVGAAIRFRPSYRGGYPILSDDGKRRVQRLQIDAEARTVTIEEIDIGKGNADSPRGMLRNGLYFVHRDPMATTIEVHSTGGEPAITTSFEPGRDYFRVHSTGQYVITDDGNNKSTCDTADVWTLTPDGTFAKTRTLSFEK